MPMKSAPWIQTAFLLSLAYVGIFSLIEPEILYKEKAPFFALLAAAGLITQQIGRMAATSRHRIDWLDNASLLLAAFYAGCSGWYWIAGDANSAGPAWTILFLVLIIMALFGGGGWVAYILLRRWS